MTVVDNRKVEASDLGNNFFVTADSLGQPRAKVVLENLLELNPFVQGNYLETDPATLVQQPEQLKQYTLIIASQLPEAQLVPLAAFCEANAIPLVAVRAYGLYGYLRVCAGEHCIVETKQDNVVEDLRLFNPWPELVEFANSFQLEALSDQQHAHVPYVVLLIQFLNRWRREHNGTVPELRADKELFKAHLKKAMRRQDEENFEEAIKNAHRAFAPVRLSSELRQLLEADPTPEQLARPGSFWILVAALRAFMANEGAGLLPLSGALPDMASDTETYIRLQGLYADKAARDQTALAQHARAIAERLGRPAPSEFELRQFCRNAQLLQVQRFKPLADELDPERIDRVPLQNSLRDNDPLASLYVLFRAVERFRTRHGRYPGRFDDEVSQDLPVLQGIASELLQELQVDPALLNQNLLHEFVRCGAAELHSVAAFMGGVAAQEAIKLITQKWVPLNHTFLYNGGSSTCATIRP